MQMSIATLLLVCASAGLAAPPCPFRNDLYQERTRLADEYRREWEKVGRTSSPETERLFGAQKANDKEYLAFLYAQATAFSRRDLAAVESCCTAAAGDPIVSPFCALLRYLAGGKADPSAFIASLP